MLTLQPGRGQFWDSNCIIFYSFLRGLTLKPKVPFTRQEAKGVGGVISKILITRVNKLGMLSQQAHAGCFTRDLTSQQREVQGLSSQDPNYCNVQVNHCNAPGEPGPAKGLKAEPRTRMVWAGRVCEWVRLGKKTSCGPHARPSAIFLLLACFIIQMVGFIMPFPHTCNKYVASTFHPHFPPSPSTSQTLPFSFCVSCVSGVNVCIRS